MNDTAPPRTNAEIAAAITQDERRKALADGIKAKMAVGSDFEGVAGYAGVKIDASVLSALILQGNSVNNDKNHFVFTRGMASGFVGGFLGVILDKLLSMFGILSEEDQKPGIHIPAYMLDVAEGLMLKHQIEDTGTTKQDLAIGLYYKFVEGIQDFEIAGIGLADIPFIGGFVHDTFAGLVSEIPPIDTLAVTQRLAANGLSTVDPSVAMAELTRLKTQASPDAIVDPKLVTFMRDQFTRMEVNIDGMLNLDNEITAGEFALEISQIGKNMTVTDPEKWEPVTNTALLQELFPMDALNLNQDQAIGVATAASYLMQHMASQLAPAPEAPQPTTGGSAPRT